MFLTWKKIRADLLFSLAEIKFIHSNHGVLKSFAINQSESIINYMEILSFLISTNQNRALIARNFHLLKIPPIRIQLYLLGKAYLFWIQTIKIKLSFTVITVVSTNQNQVFTDFKIFYRSEQNYVYETSQSSNFTEFFWHNWHINLTQKWDDLVFLSGLYYCFDTQFKFWNFDQNFIDLFNF